MIMIWIRIILLIKADKNIESPKGMTQAKVLRPYYDVGGRKYMDLEIEGVSRRVKVPFRYGRVMCRMTGLRTIQEIKAQEIIEAQFEKKIWEGQTHWIISELSS
jgi:hypothetical protein